VAVFDKSQIPPSEQGLLAELRDLSAESAPRRFALCVLDVERDDGVVLGWGLADDHEAIAYLPREDCSTPGFLSAGSATRIPRMLRRTGDVRLIWIDAEPTDL
jgi:hypothetical protein